MSKTDSQETADFILSIKIKSFTNIKRVDSLLPNHAIALTHQLFTDNCVIRTSEVGTRLGAAAAAPYACRSRTKNQELGSQQFQGCPRDLRIHKPLSARSEKSRIFCVYCDSRQSLQFQEHDRAKSQQGLSIKNRSS
eukprot:scaffold62317_cov41-Cyclotella_meneghiniana.AAC.2